MVYFQLLVCRLFISNFYYNYKTLINTILINLKYSVKDGKYRIYNGNRDLNSLIQFIKEKQWQSIEPSSAWFSPNSIL